MPTPGGYSINPGLYRVPDLLNEEQFVKYMKDTYNRDIEFVDDLKPSSARALGQSFNIAPPMDVDTDSSVEDARSLMSAKDPVLQSYNEYDFGSAYGEQAAEKALQEQKAAEEAASSSAESEPTTPKTSTSTSKTSASTKK